MGTDHTLPDPDPLDLLASSTVDGEPPPAPTDDLPVGVEPTELARRVVEFGAVANMVATPVPSPPPEVVDAQIALALEMARAVGAEEPDPAGPAAVTALGSRRQTSGSARRWLAVAAAVAVVVLVGSIVAAQIRGSRSGSTADVAASSPSPSAAAQSDLGADSAPPDNGVTPESGSSMATATAAPIPDLGDVPSEQALAQLVTTSALHGELAATPSTATTAAAVTTAPTPSEGSPGATSTSPAQTRAADAPPSCDAATRAALHETSTLVYAATAHIRGLAVQVLVYDHSGTLPVYRVVVVDATTCEIHLDITV